MEFIKKMKTREFIEMGLKTLAALCAAFIAIILMEVMIYNIQFSALQKYGTQTVKQSNVVAYCVEQDEDEYFIVYYMENTSKDDDVVEWFASNAEKDLKTKAECLAMKDDYKDVIFGKPSAFDFTITPIHYVIMSVLIAAVGGYFAYRFVVLAKEYKKIETTFKKTGTIEL